MEESIAIVYCTREKSGESNTFVDHLKETCGCNCHVFAIHNPGGVSISKIYGDILIFVLGTFSVGIIWV